MTKNIDFINIDSDSNYYNTAEQIRLKGIKWFTDSTEPSVLTGSNAAIGFFARKNILKDTNPSGEYYITSSTVTDDSGNSRKILAGTNDYLTSSILDSYKHGVEILREKDWTSGIVKISAGTAGHLYGINRYGTTDARIILEENYYSEIDAFNAIEFVESGGTYDSSGRYPLFIKSDFNQPEKIVMDGIIEPFPIRPVVSNFSLNVPFEPRSFKGQFGNGNVNWRFSSDQVLSVDYRKIDKNNTTWYLDSVGSLELGSGSLAYLGSSSNMGYINTEEKPNPAFTEDGEKPRGYPLTSSYGSQLSSALLSLPPGGTTYVSDGQVSSACGFTYENSVLGTDSITYGGFLY